MLTPQVRSTETLRNPPTVAVDVQRDVVTISVHPPERAEVRRIVMDLPDSRSWAAPMRSDFLSKNGVRATFRHPHATYAFVVTLNNGTQHRVTVTASGHLEVLSQEPPQSQPPVRRAGTY